MPCLAKANRVVVAGIPGVGKTTVIDEAVTLLKRRGRRVKVVVFGTVMLEEAQKLGVKHRDELRRLPVPVQRTLQVKAAQTIARMRSDILIVDTHLFLKTREGYWPGLPFDVLQALAPTNVILVEASVSEVVARRKKDSSRYRDQVPEKTVEQESSLAREMLAATGVITGATLLRVLNSEGKAHEAAQAIASALEG